jgi:phosphoserine phosphatase
VSTCVERAARTTAAFFDLDKTIISRSSTLAFAPSFYQHGLITRSEVIRGACAQLIFRIRGAGPNRMGRARDQVSALCSGWHADQVGEIVSRHLMTTIVPHVYVEARELLAAHAAAGHDVIIVSSSGQEMVAPIGALLGVSEVIATRMEVAAGRRPPACGQSRPRAAQDRPGPRVARARLREPVSGHRRARRLSPEAAREGPSSGYERPAQGM